MFSHESGEVFSRPLPGRGSAVADLDNDGLLDFAVSQNFGPPSIARNRTAGGNWISLQLEGAGKSNRDAIGAEVTLTAGGNEQRAQIMGGMSYCSASDMHLHFGLGTARLVDRIDIKWPSGQLETLHNLPVNRVRQITERIAAH
jgi:enediyne biosynthesis protein E4